jgi:8-oxo-dGTP pyrophosphatase MutT (NUDIX family)
VLDIPRAAAPLFGIIGRGVQLLVNREDGDGLRVWVAKRSMAKRGFPGMWDATVGGALGTGEGVLEGLVREAGEEARFGEKLVRERARACGTVCYVYVTDERSGGETGLVCPEVQFVYDLCAGEEMVPVSGDGEVEEFVLVDMGELRERLERGEFRPASACVMIDFMVRHGVLTAENEDDYEEITQRLHRFIDLAI